MPGRYNDETWPAPPVESIEPLSSLYRRRGRAFIVLSSILTPLFLLLAIWSGASVGLCGDRDTGSDSCASESRTTVVVFGVLAGVSALLFFVGLAQSAKASAAQYDEEAAERARVRAAAEERIRKERAGGADDAATPLGEQRTQQDDSP